MTAERWQLFNRGLVRINEWCTLNRFVVPIVKATPVADWRVNTCAYYRPNMINICIERCASLGYGGRSWSWPGYVVDREPYGVLAHELGHFVDFTVSEHKGAYFGDFSVLIRAAADEPPLTSYAPNDAEWFAEMFRLFVTNPDLLRLVRPQTYVKLTAAGLHPLPSRGWAIELADAPERTLTAALNKIRKGLKP